MKKNNPHILIIRFSSIGDIILTTPIIRALKKQLNATVSIVTKEKYKGLLMSNPYVDHIFTYEQKAPLIQLEFDIIVDLQKNRKSYFLAKSLKTPRITFDKCNVKKWLMVNVNKNASPIRHIIDRYFDCVTVLGVTNDGEGLDYFYDKEDFKTPYHDYPYLVLNCGGTYFTKRIPISKINECIEQSPIKVVLLGGNDVSHLNTQLLKHENCINLIGKTSLDESAFIIENSQLLITSDSALMHIGAALDVNIAVMWGNTSASFGMEPRLNHVHNKKTINFKVPNLKCIPCSKLGFEKCPKGHFRCMNNQNVKNVLSSFDLLP